MIKYRLKCTQGHEFEAWFASSESYEAQARADRVCCPDCGARDVVKAIMAPSVSLRRADGDDAGAAKSAQVAEFLRELRRTLLARAEDVGERFPEEARKIHYGEARAREIAGTASGEDVRALQEEGIEVLSFPPLPKDAN